MEEKHMIKINISTFFLIIAIIGIIVMGFFMYQLYTQKNSAEEKLSNLEREVNGLENTIIDSSDKESSNVIENVAKKESSSEKEDKENVKKNLSESEAKKILSKFLDLYYNTQSNTLNLISELGLTKTTSQDDYKVVKLEDKKGYGVEYFYDTKISYTKFEEEILKYMTESVFEKYLSIYVQNIDGKLYIVSDGGSDDHHEIKSLKYVSSNSDTYKYKASIVSYTADHVDITEDESKPFTTSVSITSKNGHNVISDINFEI